jgi:hypothetical protein
MTTRLFTTAFFLFLSLGIFAQRNGGLNGSAGSSVNQLAAAKAFGISIVQTYFNSNCPSVYESLAPQILDFKDGIVKPKTSVRKTDFCATTPLKDKTTPYTQYVANHEPEILDHIQFAARYPSLQAIYNLRLGDFYFDGAALKPGGLQLFINPDAVRFVTRKNSRGVFQITMIKLP